MTLTFVITNSFPETDPTLPPKTVAVRMTWKDIITAAVVSVEKVDANRRVFLLFYLQQFSITKLFITLTHIRTRSTKHHNVSVCEGKTCTVLRTAYAVHAADVFLFFFCPRRGTWIFRENYVVLPLPRWLLANRRFAENMLGIKF